MNRGINDEALQQEVNQLKRQLGSTKWARLYMAKRLRARSAGWNAFLVASTISATLVSVTLLADHRVYGGASEAMMVVVAVSTLSASLLITTSNYAARSDEAFKAYRDLQMLQESIDLHAKIERESHKDNWQKYQDLLEHQANHAEADYGMYVLFERVSARRHNAIIRRINKIESGRRFIFRSARKVEVRLGYLQATKAGESGTPREVMKYPVGIRVRLYASIAATYLPLAMTLTCLMWLAPMGWWLVSGSYFPWLP